MPSAGDSNNLRPNLNMLAQLAGKPGAKLSYSPGSGLFSIDENTWYQGLARSFSKDSVEKEEYFGQPIRELFAAARTNKSIDATLALNGLNALRQSYTGDKLRILDEVIEDASLGTRKDGPDFVTLRQRYSRYLLFGFKQSMFLPVDNEGVCYSFTVHWARRILVGNKPNWGISKKLPEAHPITLGRDQKERLISKVTGKIAPLQAELERYPMGQWANRIDEVLSSDKRFSKYADLKIESIISTSWPKPIAANWSGGAFINEVLRRAGNNPDCSIFILNLKGGQKGHAVGIHPGTAGLHIFDPNFGEFLFPDGSDQDKQTFLNIWLRSYRDTFDGWGLDGVKRNH
jgi:Yersinia/Haemophilus virulence surface antigen